MLHPDTLRDIIAHPDRDEPRLTMADWLEENGQQDRADFIRCQVALAKTPPWLPTECDVCGNTADEDGMVNHGKGCYVADEDGGGSTGADDNPLYEALRRRERELMTGPATQIGLDTTVFWPIEFRRGFVEVITCTWSDWQQHADAIRASTPLRRVRLTTEPMLYSSEDGRSVFTYCSPRWMLIEYSGNRDLMADELRKIYDPVPGVMGGVEFEFIQHPLNRGLVAHWTHGQTPEPLDMVWGE